MMHSDLKAMILISVVIVFDPGRVERDVFGGAITHQPFKRALTQRPTQRPNKNLKWSGPLAPHHTSSRIR